MKQNRAEALKEISEIEKSEYQVLHKRRTNQNIGNIMTKIKGKLKETPSGVPPKIAEEETGALPVKYSEYFNICDSELVIAIGGVSNKRTCDHTPLWVEFGYDPELQEKADALEIEHATLFIGPKGSKYIESFFIRQLANGDDKIEPFSTLGLYLEEGESPFKRSAKENGIRYLEPISDKISGLPDDCGKPYDNYLMKWFKFWSQAAVTKYGEDAAIQFQDFDWSR